MHARTSLALLLLTVSAAQARYYGLPLGDLNTHAHGARGQLFAVDARTLFLRGLHYDGAGPSAYFYVGTSGSPSGRGARLRDERGGAGPLRAYRGEDVALALPDGLSVSDLRWFSIFCDEYETNFAEVSIPRGAAAPRPVKLGGLRGAHGVRSDPVVVVDAQTLLVPNFSYDGEAPDAKFWVGRGDAPSPQGIRIPDENGREAPLRKYDRKTIVLTLPGELTVFDIGHLAVWCEAFTVDFGHVTLPAARLALVPPSLKMLGVSPQSKLNCEVLHEELAFEVRWAVAGDSIVLQLVGKLEEGEYMSFGPSGAERASQMVGADAAVAWVDKATLKGYAVDYYLDAKSQCAGVRGSCPDERLADKSNSLRLLNAALVNGYSIVTYQRGLRAADALDRPLRTNGSQAVVWAVGPLNSKGEVSYHSHFLKTDLLLEFGRPPVWNCPMPETEEDAAPLATIAPAPATAPAAPAPAAPAPVAPVPAGHTPTAIKPRPVPPPAPAAAAEPWEIPPVQCHEPADGVFYAQMGPTGGRQGYSAITGHVGWGLSWYINGLLIPEINVVRGKRYTFVVEGGSDPADPARYHPLYITDDPVGGYLHKTDEEKQSVEIFAGVRRSRGGPVPTGVGRLCSWTPDARGPPADEYPSFGAYQRSLTLVCEDGSPGVVVWTPDARTPDTVYYQCYTHRHLGWKINVLDECDAEPEAEGSAPAAAVTSAGTGAGAGAGAGDLQPGESVQVQARLTPDNHILDNTKKYEKIINTKHNYNDFSNDGQQHDRNVSHDASYDSSAGSQPPPEYESPVSPAQIRDGILAAEQLGHGPGHGPGHGRDPSAPEQPLAEDEEYVVEPGARPSHFMLPPDQAPLTLQAVLRPQPGPPARAPFRRPAPPEIKKRPPPQKYSGYPLQMPTHGPYQNGNMRHNKHPPGRLPGNMNRYAPIPSMKPMPPHGPMSHGGMPHGPMTHHGPMGHGPMPPHGAIPPIPPVPPHVINQQAKLPPKYASNTPQAGIMSKPTKTLPPQSQTLSLGKTDIIANQVVKSQIILPGYGDQVIQPSSHQSYLNKPGQIILGKPMENPVPLDQQMIPTKQYPVKVASTPPPSQSNEYNMPNEVSSSDFLGESAEAPTLPPATNTGFKPSSIVVESGFKPIIREPLMASEDRIADAGADRREDTDVPDDGDAPQLITNLAFSSEKLTETFEPMFIPSPEDHMLPLSDITREVFPNNHAKEDRPHPVYKPESTFQDLFSDKNLNKLVSPNMFMESNRVSAQYLPPRTSDKPEVIPQETFTSYDGKVVSAVSFTRVNEPWKNTTKQFSAKIPSNAEILLKTPQFGPFKGELPPLSTEATSSEATTTEAAKEETTTEDAGLLGLKLINLFYGDDSEEVETEAPKKDNITEEKDSDVKVEENDEEYEDDYEDEEESNETRRRKRRDTKDMSFYGEVQESVPKPVVKNQVDFETVPSRYSKGSQLVNVFSHTVLLLICLKLV